MGLDIQLLANNYEALVSGENTKILDDYSINYGLSREFCNLVLSGSINGYPRSLIQIGNITGVDMSPIIDMIDCPEEIYNSSILEEKENEIVKQYESNIDRLIVTINTLIEKLSYIDHLEIQLDQKFLNSDDYFSDFKIDKGKEGHNVNLGQDLRNFKRFLDFAKSNGTSNVWFFFG